MKTIAKSRKTSSKTTSPKKRGLKRNVSKSKKITPTVDMPNVRGLG